MSEHKIYNKKIIFIYIVLSKPHIPLCDILYEAMSTKQSHIFKTIILISLKILKYYFLNLSQTKKKQ